MTRVVILSPINNSLYSLLVTHLCHVEANVEVVGVVVRSIWNRKRFRGEIKRDGTRLLRKIWYKIFLNERYSTTNRHHVNSLQVMAHQVGLQARTLRDLCKVYQIPIRFVADHNDQQSLNLLKIARPDVVTFTGGGLIRQPLLDLAGRGVLNAHTGILPQYRGMDVVEWPVLEGHCTDVGLGVTLHFMNKGVDTGPILARRPVAVEKTSDFSSIRNRCLLHMVELIIEGVRMTRDDKLRPQPQTLEEGRQYFVMHPRLRAIAQQRLEEITDAM